MTGPFHLPADTGEGDWIEVQHLGAYGQALATRFNGFHSDVTVAILED
jgi:ornithine decarboxylase